MTISLRLWLLVAASVIAMSALMAFSLQEIHQRLVEDKKEQLRVTSDMVVNEVNRYVELAANGKLSEETAKTRALNWLKTVRYDQKNYFWITDKQPKMVMHPFKPQLDGQDLRNSQDKVGNTLFVDMVNAVNQGKGIGYVEYYWSRPGEEEPIPKLSVVREIPDWGWVIGTGIYIDDIDETYNSALMSGLIITATAMVILLLLALFIIRQVSGSIQRIVEGMKGIETTMEFDHRLPVLNNELGCVSTSFNSLLSEISSSIHEANQVVGGIAQADFTQRIQGQYQGDLSALKQGVNASAEQIDFMMTELEKVMNGMRAGDLQMKMDPQVPPAFRDKVEGALASINQVIHNANQVM